MIKSTVCVNRKNAICPLIFNVKRACGWLGSGAVAGSPSIAAPGMAGRTR